MNKVKTQSGKSIVVFQYREAVFSKDLRFEEEGNSAFLSYDA